MKSLKIEYGSGQIVLLLVFKKEESRMKGKGKEEGRRRKAKKEKGKKNNT